MRQAVKKDESGKGNALMPRGHFLLPPRKRKQKEAREHISRDPLVSRHCGSLLSNSHVGSRSARRPKTRFRLKHFGRLVFSERTGKATPILPLKSPTCTQLAERFAALAFRQRFRRRRRSVRTSVALKLPGCATASCVPMGPQRKRHLKINCAEIVPCRPRQRPQNLMAWLVREFWPLAMRCFA